MFGLLFLFRVSLCGFCFVFGVLVVFLIGFGGFFPLFLSKISLPDSHHLN